MEVGGNIAGPIQAPKSISDEAVKPVYLIYLDESGSTGSNLSDLLQPIHVVAAVLIRDCDWLNLERARLTPVPWLLCSTSYGVSNIFRLLLKNTQSSVKYPLLCSYV